MADLFFPNVLPEAPDGGEPLAASLLGLLSLPYPRLTDRILRAALWLKNKAIHLCFITCCLV
jgi:hypothetical protein